MNNSPGTLIQVPQGYETGTASHQNGRNYDISCFDAVDGGPRQAFQLCPITYIDQTGNELSDTPNAFATPVDCPILLRCRECPNLARNIIKNALGL
jgi:hypothetical protein